MQLALEDYYSWTTLINTEKCAFYTSSWDESAERGNWQEIRCDGIPVAFAMRHQFPVLFLCDLSIKLHVLIV